MFGFLEKLGYPALIATFGFILILGSLFSVSDITKLQISPLQTPNYLILSIGFIVLGISIWLWLKSKNVKLPSYLADKFKPVKQSCFISAPMNSYKIKGKPEAYQESRKEILKLMAALRSSCQIKKVFYAGELIDSVDGWDLPGVPLQNDLRKIREYEYSILMWTEKYASRSCLIEAGIALTLDKKSIYFVKHKDDLPFLLQSVQSLTNKVKIIKFTNTEDLLQIIRRNNHEIFEFKSSQSLFG